MARAPIPRPDYSRAGSARERLRTEPLVGPPPSQGPAPDFSRAGANRELVTVAKAVDVADVAVTATDATDAAATAKDYGLIYGLIASS